MTYACIVDPNFLWPGLIRQDVEATPKFFIVRRPDEVDEVVISEKIKAMYPDPKIVFVKEVTAELIERFKNVKRVATVVDFRPTAIELQVAPHSMDIVKGLMMWRNNQPFENPRGLTTCITIPLYLLETIRALSNSARFDASYNKLREISARFEEFLDIDFDANEEPLAKHLIEKTRTDEMGFRIPSRSSMKMNVFQHFLENFAFEDASAVFDLENLDFITACIEMITQAIGTEGTERPEGTDEEKGVTSFPDIPYELRELLQPFFQGEKNVHVSTDNATSSTVIQLKSYAPALVHIGPNSHGAVDVIVIETGCIETQHTILGHYLGDPNKLSDGGILYFQNPCPETDDIVRSFELPQQQQKGSMFCRLFESYLRFDRFVRLHNGGILVVAKTN